MSGLLALQTTVGNAATTAAVQRSLFDDVLERGVFDGAMLAQADRGLPRSLIEHYMEGSGDPYRLTVAEMLEVDAYTRVFEWFPQIVTAAYELTALAAQAQASQAFAVPVVGATGRGAALKNQTLGNFRVTLNGELTHDAAFEGPRFTGTATYYDYWDFDPKIKATFIDGTSGRTTAGEGKTIIGSFMEGRPFPIVSVGVVHLTEALGDERATITANAVARPARSGSPEADVGTDIADSVGFAGEVSDLTSKPAAP